MLKHTEQDIKAALENVYNRGPKRAILDFIVNDEIGCIRCMPDDVTRYTFSRNDDRIICSRAERLRDDWFDKLNETVQYCDNAEWYFQYSTLHPVVFSQEMFEYILKLLSNE